MSDKDCLFCKIIAGEIPSEKVYEDDTTYAFKGHQLKARCTYRAVCASTTRTSPNCCQRRSGTARPMARWRRKSPTRSSMAPPSDVQHRNRRRTDRVPRTPTC